VPDNNNVHEVWSDRELDDAMAALYANATVNQEAQAKARAELLLAANAGVTPQNRTAMPQPTVKTRRVAPLAAAAAVVALVTVGAVLVVSQSSSPNEIGSAQSSSVFAPTRPPATSGGLHAPMPPMPDKPQNNLDVLATRVPETPLTPGQYRYLSIQAWHRFGTSGTTLAEYRGEVWIPADQQQEWMSRNQTTGNNEWIEGLWKEAHAYAIQGRGVHVDVRLTLPSGERRATCGNLMPDRLPIPCELRTAVPVQPANDSAMLYKWLASRSDGDADAPVRFFREASNLLDASYPATVRRATLEALSRHPYLTVADTTTRDNRPAISVGIEYDDGHMLDELLLDPANGQLIGKRSVYLKDADGAKAGDKLHDEIRHEAVVNRIGAEPTR
jgi:hypothetical protein